GHREGHASVWLVVDVHFSSTHDHLLGLGFQLVRGGTERNVQPEDENQMTGSDNLLEIRNLSVEYSLGNQTNQALSGVDVTLGRKEVLCLVGESGCGKSTLGLAIMG